MTISGIEFSKLLSLLQPIVLIETPLMPRVSATAIWMAKLRIAEFMEKVGLPKSLHRLVVCFLCCGIQKCDCRYMLSNFVYELLCFHSSSGSPSHMGRLSIWVASLSGSASHLGHILYVKFVCHILCVTFCVSHFVHHTM